MNGRSESSPTTTTYTAEAKDAKRNSVQTQEERQPGQVQAVGAPMPPQYTNNPSQVVPQQRLLPQQAHFHPWGSAVEPAMALAAYESGAAMGSSVAPVMRPHSNVAHPHHQIHIANQINIANNNPYAMHQEPRQNAMQRIAFNGLPAPPDVPGEQRSALDDEIATLEEQLIILNRLRALRERRRSLDM